MVGWVRLQAQGPAGTTITLRHAEVLDKQGNLYTANLRGAKATARYTLKGGARETLRAALHVLRLPVRRGRRLSGRPHARRAHGHRRALRHAGDGRVRDVGPDGQPAAAQHHVGPEGQLPGRAHRLPPARRAARLDRRRPGLRPHGGVQHGRRGVLHQVARRRRGRSVRRRARAARDPERAQRQPDVAAGRVGCVGRCGGHHSLDDVPHLRRHAPPRTPVRQHGQVGRVRADARRRRTSSGTATRTSATGWPSRAPTPATRAPPPART